MLNYLVRRVLIMIPTLLVTSALIFTVMNLSPTDYFSNLVSEMQAQGEKVDTARIEFMKKEYGFDKPVVERYFLWVGGFLHGDFGYSFEYQMPVNKVVGDRVFLTILLSFTTIVFTWLVAFPIGIYSATHQYSWADYGLTTLGVDGPRHPAFPVGSDLPLFRQHVVRPVDRRAHGPQIFRPALQLAESGIDPEPSLDPGRHHRHGRYRAA